MRNETVKRTHAGIAEVLFSYIRDLAELWETIAKIPPTGSLSQCHCGRE